MGEKREVSESWIVELEPGVWLAEWSGDPGRTTQREYAKEYSSEAAAINARARARRLRKLPNARLVCVSKQEEGK